MRIIYTILLVIITVLVFVFATLNAGSVNVNYFLATADVPLPILLVQSLGVGLIIGLLFAGKIYVHMRHQRYKDSKKS